MAKVSRTDRDVIVLWRQQEWGRQKQASRYDAADVPLRRALQGRERFDVASLSLRKRFLPLGMRRREAEYTQGPETGESAIKSERARRLFREPAHQLEKVIGEMESDLQRHKARHVCSTESRLPRLHETRRWCRRRRVVAPPRPMRVVALLRPSAMRARLAPSTHRTNTILPMHKQGS